VEVRGHALDPLVALGVNEQPPFAVVNLGRGNLQLDRAAGSGGGACKVGGKWLSRWRAGDVVLDLDLTATDAGKESCGFDGTASVTRGEAKAAFRVRGACGC
jgi:hypothetical protein